MATTCVNCGAEIEEHEVEKCQHCDLDGLGPCCIHYSQHWCTYDPDEDEDPDDLDLDLDDEVEF